MKILICILLFLLIFPRNVTAHTTESSGDVKALLHIDPDDKAVAGEKSTFHFEFSDDTNAFTMSNCECRAEVFLNDKSIFTGPLSPGSSHPQEKCGNFTFTLPTSGLYTIKLSAKPIKPETFKDIELSYTVEAGTKDTSGVQNEVIVKSENQNSLNKVMLTVLGFFFLTATILYSMYLFKNGRK